MPRKVFVAGEVLTAADVNTNLADQAVMTFAGTAARGSAIGTAVEGMVTYLEDTDSFEYWDGSSWDELTLPVSTTTPVSGDSLVYDGSNWVNGPRSGNAIINGDFGIWQRGTSVDVVTGSPGYAADRFFMWPTTAGTATVSRSASTLTGFEYAARVQRPSGDTDTNPRIFGTVLENSSSVPFAGNKITVSFYARKGANYSGSSDQLNIRIIEGTGSDQGFIAVWSGYSATINTDIVLTSGWQRFQFSIDANSATKQFLLGFRTVLSGTAGADDWYEITGVQLEAGPVATPFTLAGGGSKAAELALCQRYYYKLADGLNHSIANISYYSSTDARGTLAFPGQMRSSPSLDIVTGSGYYKIVAAGATDTFDSFSFFFSGVSATNLRANSGVSGTAGNAGNLITDNAASYVALDAEL